MRWVGGRGAEYDKNNDGVEMGSGFGERWGNCSVEDTRKCRNKKRRPQTAKRSMLFWFRIEKERQVVGFPKRQNGRG